MSNQVKVVAIKPIFRGGSRRAPGYEFFMPENVAKKSKSVRIVAEGEKVVVPAAKKPDNGDTKPKDAAAAAKAKAEGISAAALA